MKIIFISAVRSAVRTWGPIRSLKEKNDHLAVFKSVMSVLKPFYMLKMGVKRDLMPRGNEAVKALARLCGATIGVKYAEAFVLIRETL